MWAEISRLAVVEQVTVLLTTHYLDEADHLADRLAIIDHGRVVAEGTPDELKSELAGDTVQLEVVDLDDISLALQRLSQIEGLTEVTATGRTLRARAELGARAIPAILAALEQAQIPVASATVARPSLDDVYLRHAGRTFEEVAR
jgi:ABC-2 type transport system ATP-binding protein